MFSKKSKHQRKRRRLWQVEATPNCFQTRTRNPEADLTEFASRTEASNKPTQFFAATDTTTKQRLAWTRLDFWCLKTIRGKRDLVQLNPVWGHVVCEGVDRFGEFGGE